MLPLVAQLIASGIGLLGNALATKGKEVVEAKLGVSLPDLSAPVPPAKLAELRALEAAHEERLLELGIEAQKIDLEAEKAAQGAVTDRWRADMSSDSWLSKNIRPGVLAYLTIVISLMAFASEWVKVEAAWIELLKIAYVTVIGAYFVGRSAEKGASIAKRGAA